MSTRLSRLSIFLFAAFLPFPISSVSAADTLEELIADESNIVLEDISEELKRKIKPEYFNSARNHRDLERYYRDTLSTLRRMYPPSTFRPPNTRYLQKFSGEQSFSYPEIHAYSVLPISPIVQADSSVSYKKFSVDHKGRKIFGLRVTMKAKLRYMILSMLQTELAYQPTVNARVMGFSHAQLIPELTRNIEPADQFYYNSFLDWSLHQRYKKNDQIEQPIELTNYCHSIGRNIYTVSIHPDFSLAFKDWKRNNRGWFTYYLWKSKPSKNTPPDFIFQIGLVRPHQ